MQNNDVSTYFCGMEGHYQTFPIIIIVLATSQNIFIKMKHLSMKKVATDSSRMQILLKSFLMSNVVANTGDSKYIELKTYLLHAKHAK